MTFCLGTEPGYKRWFSWHTTGGDITKRPLLRRLWRKAGLLPDSHQPQVLWGGRWALGVAEAKDTGPTSSHSLESEATPPASYLGALGFPGPTQRHSPATEDKLPSPLWAIALFFF